MIELWMYIVAAYVPMIFLSVVLFKFYGSEPRKVKELFDPWKTRYGIEVEGFMGFEPQAPRLGLKLPTTPIADRSLDMKPLQMSGHETV